MESVGLQPYGEVVESFYVQTDEIYSDEPATWLAEFNHPLANGRGKGRFQRIHVLRGNHVAEWLYYLGPSGAFPSNEFQIVGGTFGAHRQDIETVASIRDEADRLRDMGGLRRAIDPDTLTVTQENWWQTIEEKDKARRHESVSGRYIKVER